MNYILGINAYHADASAALFRDGVLVAASEEERFRRVKHWAGFPVEAIRFCLETAGITLSEVDHVAIGRDPKAKFWKKVAFMLQHPALGFSALGGRLKNAREVSNLQTALSGVERGTFTGGLHQVEHHRSHLASAFFASPFPEAALLSIDGSGDFTTSMIGVGKGNKMEVLDSVDFPHSAGLFYTAFTQLLGFPHYGDEYKVMGLAPYGTPTRVDELLEVLKLENNGLFSLDLSYFLATQTGIIHYGKDHVPVVSRVYSDKLVQRFGPVRKAGEPLTQEHHNLAASVQRVTELLLFHLLNHLHQRTGLKSVCIAGGVAQNSVANGKVTRNTPFEHVYVPSAGHDAGISMGAGLYVHNQVLELPRPAPIWSAYTGSRFTTAEVEAYLKSRNITYRKMTEDDLFPYVAQRLADGAVVGWFSGPAEFGPRALGGRSILADPRRADAKELLNAKIKRRESFRPFAPSILQSHVSEYFEVNDTVPFMEKVFPIRENKKALIPAVTHVDGTGRLQTVMPEVAPRYHRLIEAFFAITGVPILLNTSFNENEPIVNSPKDALECYLRTNMDVLVLENCVVER